MLTQLSLWFLNRSRPVKRMITVSVDCFAVVLALWLAFSLRLSRFYLPPDSQQWLFLLTPVLAIPIFIRFGLYRAVIRYIGMDALLAIVKAIALYTLLLATVVVLAKDYAGVVPRTVYAINAVILILVIGGSRMLARLWFTNQDSYRPMNMLKNTVIPPVIIYGAGSAGAQLAAILKMGHQLRPVAFVDDDPALQQQQINGLTVFPQQYIPRLVRRFGVNELLLAMPSLTRPQRNNILKALENYPVHVRTLPGMTQIAQGKISVSDIREVDIDDLLGRDAVVANPDLLKRNITGKNVMVTGAGGSIGSELCRQIIRQQPAQLILFEISEFSLYQIEKELQENAFQVPVVAILGTIMDQQRLTIVCQRFKVQTIYHAAAYKHVPMVEKNISEGVNNNVMGTLRTAMAAIASDVETFVLISTDKAVRPTNTMGASKRMAELILQGLAADSDAGINTRFTMVRFGNVLGSSGSVVPLFRQQIIDGGPVTVTHPDINRYFMTIPEAAELVIQAGAMGIGGDVFVLDMGEPVKILDLARRLIHLSGLTVQDEQQPDGDIPVIFTGLRPGEKLYEELLIGENVSATQHSKIMRAQESIISWVVLKPILEVLQQAVQNRDYQEIRSLLLTHIDGYQPQCDIEDWLK